MSLICINYIYNLTLLHSYHRLVTQNSVSKCVLNSHYWEVISCSKMCFKYTLLRNDILSQNLFYLNTIERWYPVSVCVLITHYWEVISCLKMCFKYLLLRGDIILSQNVFQMHAIEKWYSVRRCVSNTNYLKCALKVYCTKGD